MAEIFLYKNRGGAWGARVDGKSALGETVRAYTLFYLPDEDDEDGASARGAALREVNVILSLWHHASDDQECWLIALLSAHEFSPFDKIPTTLTDDELKLALERSVKDDDGLGSLICHCLLGRPTQRAELTAVS